MDETGTVVHAWAPFSLVSSLGDVALAPPAEVLRRLRYGPGLVSGWACNEACTLTTKGSSSALGLVRTGGLGSHDHIPGNVIPGRWEHVLVPALRLTGGSPSAANSGVLTISSALLVDDPAQADAARRADGGSAQQGGGCVGNVVALCSSATSADVSLPIMFTIDGEV